MIAYQYLHLEYDLMLKHSTVDSQLTSTPGDW